MIPHLRAVFGHMKLTDLKPRHGYAYLDARKPHLVAGKRELEVLSHAFTKAVQWGPIDDNPILGKMRLSGEYSTPPRDRYVEERRVQGQHRLPRAGSLRTAVGVGNPRA